MSVAEISFLLSMPIREGEGEMHALGKKNTSTSLFRILATASLNSLLAF